MFTNIYSYSCKALSHLALENLSSLFLSQVENDDGSTKFLDHDTWIQLDRILPSLKKFLNLAGILLVLIMDFFSSLTGLLMFFYSSQITLKIITVQSCLICH